MSKLTPPKSILLTFAFLAAISLAPAGVQTSHAFGLGGGTKGDVESTKTIRELYSDFVKAWNKHEVEKMSSRWAIDGDHVEPDGTVAKGRDEVKELLTKQHSSIFKNTKLELAVKSVWMISDNVALVDGTYELTGAVLPDGTPVPARKGLLTSVLMQERGVWAIAASRLMIPTQLPYKKPTLNPADAASPKKE